MYMHTYTRMHTLVCTHAYTAVYEIVNKLNGPLVPDRKSGIAIIAPGPAVHINGIFELGHVN